MDSPGSLETFRMSSKRVHFPDRVGMDLTRLSSITWMYVQIGEASCL